jgi:hypothetical protein
MMLKCKRNKDRRPPDIGKIIGQFQASCKTISQQAASIR